jgi:hypothetical protein
LSAIFWEAFFFYEVSVCIHGVEDVEDGGGRIEADSVCHACITAWVVSHNDGDLSFGVGRLDIVYEGG